MAMVKKDGKVRFEFGGESLTAVIDPKTRKWSLEGHVLDPQAERVVISVLEGPDAVKGIPPRSPADGVAWMADAREAAERLGGIVELPDVEEDENGEDKLY